jgi:hypothetical protein
LKRLPSLKGFLSLLIDQFEDQTLRILLIAATLTLLTGIFSAFYGTKANSQYQWVEGASIFVAAAFIAIFTASCDYAK